MVLNIKFSLILSFSLLLLPVHAERGKNENYHLQSQCLNDFLTKLNKPLMIHMGNLCWPRIEQIDLTKLLHKRNYRTAQYKNEQDYEKLHRIIEKERVIFLVDLNCRQHAKQIIRFANQTGLFDAPYTWIWLNLRQETLEEGNPFLPVGSRVYVMEKQQQEGMFNYISLYKLPHIQQYHTNDVARWENGEFLYFINLADGKHRRNLLAVPMNSTLVATNPDTLQHLMDGRNKHIDPTTKTGMPLVNHMMDYVNTSVSHIYVHPTWGYKDANGTFHGMIADYKYKRVEIAVAASFIITERLNVVQPFIRLSSLALFIFKQPPLSYVKNIYMLPFNLPVWLACFAILVVFFASFFVISHLERRYPSVQERNNENIALLEPNISDLILLDISAVCQQGIESEPASAGGKLATYLLLLSTLFLFTAYSANIVSLLQSTSKSINSMETLHYSKMKVGIEDTPYARYFFKIAPGEMLQAFYKEKVAPPGKPSQFMNVADGIKRMRNEFFAIHAERTTLYKLIQDQFYEDEKCGLGAVSFLGMMPYFGCRRHSPYAEIFGSGFRKFSEYGIVNREYYRIYVQRPKCNGKSAIFLSVSMNDTYAAYQIFGIGIVFCFLVFVIEHIAWYKWHGHWSFKMKTNLLGKSILVGAFNKTKIFDYVD